MLKQQGRQQQSTTVRQQYHNVLAMYPTNWQTISTPVTAKQCNVSDFTLQLSIQVSSS